MTTYAYDSATTTLLATWTCGIGAGARSVARLHARTPDRIGMHLAQALTELSDAAWAGYRAPAPEPPRSERVLQALHRPNRPVGDLLYIEPDELLERAHDVGRRLLDVGSAGVVRAVAADVEADLDAVTRALCGELDGRARQAVALTRLDAPRAQVAAADRLLHAEPLGNEELFADVEPTAACVAGVHWMAAAVDVLLREAGVDPDTDDRDEVRAVMQVLDAEAAGEGVDLLGPCAILSMLRGGQAPVAIVQGLVSTAVLAGDGVVLGGHHVHLGDAPDGPRSTLLPPRRPAKALLGTLTGVNRACLTVFAERCDPDAVHGDGDWVELTRARFTAAVRAEAARRADRLHAVPLQDDPAALAADDGAA